MDAPGALPPALAALADAGVKLLGRAPSARLAVARAGGVLDPAALPPVLRERVEEEVATARAATCVPLPLADVERILRAAWGRAPAGVLDALEPEPVAVTPAGQVHRGEHEGAPVAVKVLRPGVERAVRADLQLLEALAPALGAAFPRLDATALLRDAREAALDELDLEHEASQQRRLARALRPVPGVAVPRPQLDLARRDVLVSAWAEGETVAAGARPEDPGAAARALVAAVRTAVLDAGLAPVDLRASHVLLRPDGIITLLGLGTARPVDRARAARALDGLRALADDDAPRFGAIAEEVGVLSRADGERAHAIARTVLGELLDGPAPLDATAVHRLAGRAHAAAPELGWLATAAAPRPEDLALARAIGQLGALLARFELTEDWVGLSR